MRGSGGAVGAWGVLVMVLLAGCLGAQPPGPLAPPSSPPATPAPRVVGHNAAGLLEGAAVVPDLDVAFRLVGHDGGEPNIGITSAGNLFETANDAVMRSQDHGATWEVVYDFGAEDGLPADLRENSDPMLWVDPLTDRIFDAPMWPVLVCSDLIFSDDEGATWTDLPMRCGIPGVDHQKLMTAPPSAASVWPLTGYPNLVYYCYNKIVSTGCAVSFDGGLTFPYEQELGVAGCGGTNGHPGASADGIVYVALPGCPTMHVGVTEDSGLTWRVRDTRFPISPHIIDAEVAVTTDGTVYVLYAGPDNRQYVGRSPDRGDTWLGPWAVSPPGVRSTWFHGLVAGDPGRVAMAYLGTRDGSGEQPQEVPDTARWHLYYTFSETADAEEPVFYSQQVTPDEDPVQVGCIWVNGFPSGACRNMLDFIDMVTDAEGRPYIAYTEGCVDACAGKADATGVDSRASEGAFAVLDHGPSLNATTGWLPSLGLQDLPGGQATAMGPGSWVAGPVPAEPAPAPRRATTAP